MPSCRTKISSRCAHGARLSYEDMSVLHTRSTCQTACNFGSLMAQGNRPANAKGVAKLLQGLATFKPATRPLILFVPMLSCLGHLITCWISKLGLLYESREPHLPSFRAFATNGTERDCIALGQMPGNMALPPLMLVQQSPEPTLLEP